MNNKYNMQRQKLTQMVVNLTIDCFRRSRLTEIIANLSESTT